MLEIFAVIFLCRTNGNNAAMRGRSRGLAYAYTVVLWVGFEFLGWVITVNLLGDIAFSNNYASLYLGAVAGATIGGILSWVISSVGEKVRETPSNLLPEEVNYIQQSRTLSSPCQVNVTREKDFAGSIATYSIQLNGREVGQIKNGEAASFLTTNHLNIFSVNDKFGNRLPGTVVFEAPAGGRVDVFIKGNNVLPDRTQVFPGVPAPAGQAAPVAPPTSDSGYCRHCGAERQPDSAFCPSCGKP